MKGIPGLLQVISDEWVDAEITRGSFSFYYFHLRRLSLNGFMKKSIYFEDISNPIRFSMQGI